MAKIAFTRHLAGIAPAGPVEHDAATLGELLEAVAAGHPRLRSYVLDDQGRLRKHIAVFVDGELRRRETALALPMTKASEVHVFQALSGG